MSPNSIYKDGYIGRKRRYVPLNLNINTRADVFGILLSSLLNLELKSLTFSFVLAFRLDNSLMSNVVVLSSPNLARNHSSNISQLVMEGDGNCWYHSITILFLLETHHLSTFFLHRPLISIEID